MKYKFHEKKNQKGFTLMELLSVVLIIGILAAIALPNVAALSKRLQMAQLDEFARQIYLAAQNETVKMKASGRLEAFYKEMDEAEEGYGAIWSLENNTGAPQDYPEGDTTWKLLYYIPSDNALVQEYFLQAGSALNIATEKGGNFILELSPMTGDVYSAFYVEREDFEYDEVNTLRSRERGDREEAKIGYYCGAASNPMSTLPGKFEPKVEIKNGEELRAEITCEGMSRFNGTQRKLKLLVTVTDESGGENWTKEYTGGTSELSIVGDEAYVSLLLDSVEDGEGFDDITDEKLTPGEDITVKAEFTYTNGDIAITGEAQDKGNSLFEYRRSAGTSGLEIGVGCVRHLYNLRESKYKQAEDQRVDIKQTRNIDFASSDVKLSAFEPIENSTLFKKSDVTFVTYDGGNNLLKEFIIADSGVESGTGLFLSIEKCSLKNIRLVDCIVTGARSTGALCGIADSAAITNCGVFLSTKNEYGRYDDMDARVEKYKVTGKTGSAGGLVGNAVNSTITNCFAAIAVDGTMFNVGGLVGYQQGGKIINCYSSGTVKAVPKSIDLIWLQEAGGLVGNCDSGTIEGCYSTADVTTAVNGGGLIGSALNATVTDSRSYGQILMSEGQSAGGGVGGFVGMIIKKDGFTSCSFTSCSYLIQAKYNDSFLSDKPDGVEAKTYQELKSSVPNASENSEPYSNNLVSKAFPFPQIQDFYESGSTMRHYGDWPKERKLQTSLVYYEKYQTEEKEETYGYYAVTSLTAATGDGEQNSEDVNSWKLDTLRDEACVEDGYAIITPYALTSFTYKLNDDLNKNSEALGVKVGVGAGEATQIETNITMEFKSKGEDGEDIEYKITNANVYRLPFQLQMTDRQMAYRFYDKLTLTGYVESNGTSNEVFKDYTFYYCPHFAKNAINPSFSTKDAILPDDPDSVKEEYVYVRSARQLNALGRNPYYWNKSKDLSGNEKNREFEFKQETDIDFGQYVKTYCGQEFNLMETESANEYRNVPIGRPNTPDSQGTMLANNFRYVYDGCGHKITDFCCISKEYQFTGLFGEVQNGTLKNIVMAASEPEEGSAYVESSFSEADKSPGVGALVGLLYVDKEESYDSRVATVENCAVSGYKITYSGTSVADGVAVGGLAGFNFGIVKNSSAVNKITEFEKVYAGGHKLLAGGLVGSLEGWGTVNGCYAGGNLGVKADMIGGDSSLGGICGGYLGIYGHSYDDSKAEVSNSYSYCTWEKDKIENNRNLTLYGAVPEEINNSNCYYLKDGIGSGIKLQNVDGVEAKSMKELEYLSQQELPGFGRAAEGSSFPWDEKLKGSAFPFPAIVKTVDGDGNEGECVHYGSWPTGKEKVEKAYLSYYEVYEDQDKNLSIGYYYLDKTYTIHSELDDSNAKKIVETGYGILCSPDMNFDILCEKDENLKPIKDNMLVLDGSTALEDGILSGDGEQNLYRFDEDFRKKYLDSKYPLQKAVGVGLNYINSDGETVEQILYVNTRFAADISIMREPQSGQREAQVRTEEQLSNLNSAPFGAEWKFLQTHDIDAGDAGMLKNMKRYTYDGLNNKITGLKKPLFESNDGNIINVYIQNAYIERTDDTAILALTAEENSNIKNCIVGGTVKSNGGSAAGLVVENAGIIISCAVIADVFATSQAAGLMIYSYGDVSGCFTKGVVSADGFASGFAMTMYPNAQISECYANCRISSKSIAVGFIYQVSGSIHDCYSVGSVSADNTACGFYLRNDGKILASYAITEILKGGQTYGFGALKKEESQCYWVSSKHFNSGVMDGSNAAKLSSLSSLCSPEFAKKLGVSWTLDNATAYPDTAALGNIYPYPRLRALPHYGDWPVSGEIGAFQVFQYYDSFVINGEGYNIGSSNVQTYKVEWTWPCQPIQYGVFFSDDIDMTDWKVTYHYYPGGSSNLKEAKAEMTEVKAGSFKNSNENMRIFTFPAPKNGKYEMVDIVITAPEGYNRSFKFKYDQYAAIDPVFQYVRLN